MRRQFGQRHRYLSITAIDGMEVTVRRRRGGVPEAKPGMPTFRRARSNA